MSLVGDIILAGRELNADMPQQITSPTLVSVTAPTPGLSTTIPAGTYYAQFCFVMPWGGTGPVSVQYGPFTLDSNHRIVFTYVVPPPPVTHIRIYFGTTSGALNQFNDFAINGRTVGLNDALAETQLTYNLLYPGAYGTVPTRNTGWLPDSDGSFASAGSIYRWLNEGLSRLSKIVGGIEDETGLSSVAGQGTYTLYNPWLRLTHGWYDGLPLSFGNKGDIYKKNTVSGKSALVTLTQNGRQQTVELYPQPDRTAGTNYAISADNGSSITLTSVSGLLPSGLMKFPVGNVLGGTFTHNYDIASELVSYSSISGNVLQGCQRGLGGTVPNTAASSTVLAQELNIRFYGRRQPRLYGVGSSFMYLDVPPTWETLLPLYLSYKYKQAGQELQEASQLLQEFEREAIAMQRRDMQLAGPRQIGGPSGMGDTYGGTMYGGWIVP